MPCVLRFSAPNCDIDSSVARLALLIDGIYRQGHPYLANRPQRGNFAQSGLQIVTSEAPLSDFNQQVSDTIAFIQANQSALLLLAQEAAFSEGTILLDFGIDTRMYDVGVQVNPFPIELVKLASEIGAGLILRQYAPCEDIETEDA